MRITYRAVVMVMAVLIAWTPRAIAAPTVDRFERLFGVAKLWAEVKFFHPAMFQRAIDWDGALTRVLPEVEAANDEASYRTAVGHLLATLNDPRTRVESADAAPTATSWKTWAGAQVIVLDAALATARLDVGATRRMAREAKTDLANARIAVIDLRGRADDDDRLLSYLIEALPPTTIWPTLRSIRHVGFRSQGETNRNTYTTSWSTTAGGEPTPGGPGVAHVVFAVDPRHALPLEAIALWLSGHATLVSPAPLDDTAAAITKRIDLPWGVQASVRTADILIPGERGVVADIVTRSGEDVRARAIEVAQSIARGAAPPHGKPRQTTISNALLVANDDDLPASLPSRERRMLAAIKAWAVIAYFHGTPQLDRNWDHQLSVTLARLDGVTDFDGYVDAFAEMVGNMHDGHGYAKPRTVVGHTGSTAIFWRRIDGKVVAGGLRDEAVARDAGITLGDELVNVDGVPAGQIIAKKQARVAGGTEEGRMQWAVAIVDRGTLGTPVEIETRGRDGRNHKVTLRRDYNYESNFWAHQGPHYRMLTSDIGYADLSRLTTDELDAMFDAIGKARAIVFDMRGYPNGVGFLLAQRVNSLDASAISEIRYPIVEAHSARKGLSTRILQPLPAGDKPIYRGKVVVLIDDRAVSAAEHTCLALEAAAGATFIGSPTDGTNGEETYVRLPGGLEMRFTGMEILHVDGRPLQQVGVQPHIVVRPTLRGLRAGKDEVLDRALRYLQSGR